MSASSAFAKAKKAVLDGRDLDAKLLLAAGVTELASSIDVRPIVTGGTTVDFYAASTVDSTRTAPPGWKPSIDIDVIMLASDSIGAATRLRELLYEKDFKPATTRKDRVSIQAERGWKHPDVPIPVEIMGKPYEGDAKRIVQLDVDGMPVFLRGPEDTLWEHVEWGAHVKDQRSWTRALAIASAQRESLDLAYLRQLARERGFVDALEKCLRGEPLY